jgi:hypothetical protein
VTDLASNKMNKMKLGVVFPQTEIASDPDVVANFADGWFPFFNAGFENQIKEIHDVAINAGRKPLDIGIECMQGLGGSLPRRERCSAKTG